MTLSQTLITHVKQAVKTIYNETLDTVELQPTRKEFKGDITVVVFPVLKVVKGNPVQIGEQIGNYLVDKLADVNGFNVIKGFLNIEISDTYYLNFFNTYKDKERFGWVELQESKPAVMVEYSSPNTNKPLHLGHVRNNLLGYAVSELLKASGTRVYKTQIINDRGIHICKSMLAWKNYGNDETPESTGIKGDKLVGNYYVKFDQIYKSEVKDLINKGFSEEEAKQQAPSLQEAQQMLLKWEAGDPDVVALWEMMNGWVYEGFAETYKALGVDFDSYYYESNTYLLGKDNIDEGLAKGVFFKKEDGSVWCDLTDEGLDEKLVLRSDGTAVYMTQDIGTAIQRVKDNPDVGGIIYTVGNEQDYHFKVLFLILKKLGYTWAANLHHLSYGMVDLPSGKMKSREGTVVDADELIFEMTQTAQTISEDLGKLDGYSNEEKQKVYSSIGLAALKYYILKVDPKKRILFNPEESVDFQGNTGPFIQYTYARIQAILRRADFKWSAPVTITSLQDKERELIKQLELYPEIIQTAAKELSPAILANYTYDLVKYYNSFFQNVSIFGADSEEETHFRVQLSQMVGNVIKSAFLILGISVPDRM
ncbi:arginine--tRNA ligase [Aquimarina sp. W85]|uniref:arginine--tRNA ligase n=1 Tax=Aquimarina rhodophyticola TaxID=3342246 RepID=UPI00366B38F6